MIGELEVNMPVFSGYNVLFTVPMGTISVKNAWPFRDVIVFLSIIASLTQIFKSETVDHLCCDIKSEFRYDQATRCMTKFC